MPYSVDAANGTIQRTDLITPGPLDLAVDGTGTFVYQVGRNACQAGACSDVELFRLASGKYQFTGALQPTEGGSGPYSGAPLNPIKIVLDPTGSFVYVAAIPASGPTSGMEFRVISRALGSITPRDRDLCPDLNGMTATADGNRTYIYDSCGPKPALVQWTVIDNLKGSVLSSGQVEGLGVLEDLVVDPSGRFLLIANATQNTVDVYAIEKSTGALSDRPVQQTAAGIGPKALTFDATGQFVYVSNGGCGSSCPAASNNITSYAFRRGVCNHSVRQYHRAKILFR